MERSSTGINLGGLFDTFQIFTVDPSCKSINLIQHKLLEKTIQVYEFDGKKKAL